jgi:hypothetical protein
MRYWGLTALVLTACATEQQGPSVLDRRAEIRAVNERNYRSRDGFQSTLWGMTPDEVSLLYPAAEASPRGDLALSTTVAGRPARVTFFFTKSRLAVVRVRFTQFENVRAEHRTLAELMTAKYGAPTGALDSAREAVKRMGSHRRAADLAWTGAKISEAFTGLPADSYTQSRIDVSAERAEEETRKRALIAQNDFILQKKWESLETEINLFGRHSPEEDVLLIDYESVMLAPRLRQDLEADRLEHKREQAKDL